MPVFAHFHFHEQADCACSVALGFSFVGSNLCLFCVACIRNLEHIRDFSEFLFGARPLSEDGLSFGVFGAETVLTPRV